MKNIREETMTGLLGCGLSSDRYRAVATREFRNVRDEKSSSPRIYPKPYNGKWFVSLGNTAGCAYVRPADWPTGRWSHRYFLRELWWFSRLDPVTYPTGRFLTVASHEVHALNSAYDNLVQKLKGFSANLGETFGEMGQIRSMVVRRLNQLTEAYAALSRGRFRQFLRHLRLKTLRRHRRWTWSRPRDASSLWLEYWFGWAPLIQEVYNLVRELFNPKGNSPGGSVFKEGGAPFVGTARVPVSFHETRPAEPNDGGSRVEKGEGYIKASVGCRLVGVNPNALAWNQLGLANPAAVAWALVPFSWVVDWFANLSQLLNSFTDKVGLEMLPHADWYTTLWSTSATDYGVYKPTYASRYFSHVGRGAAICRRVGAYKPRFNLMVAHLSLTRAATAASVIVQLFSPNVRRR